MNENEQNKKGLQRDPGARACQAPAGCTPGEHHQV